jgi:8-oxo-dGTP pyrophosphatase MutT (NUDIX family)
LHEAAARELWEEIGLRVEPYRGWSLDEIRATSELVVPLGMADLLAEVAAGRVPARPVALSFHH